METEKSATCTVFPIVSALDKADDIIGKGRQWNSVNVLQRVFAPIFEALREQARNLKEIKSVASKDVEPVNSFLKDENFQIQLEKSDDPYAFYTASVLDVLVEWLEEGHVIEILSGRDNTTVYPAVSLTKGVSFAKAPSHNEIIVVIETKSGDRLCMTVGDRLEGFNLLEKVNTLRGDMQSIRGYKGVEFPQVDLDQEVDITWLLDLWAEGNDGCEYRVAQALQQTKFRMNEKGARAQSAVAIGFERGFTSVPVYLPPVVIDKPFLVWIERAGLDQPLFTGWISEENWKTPKDLSEKQEQVERVSLPNESWGIILLFLR